MASVFASRGNWAAAANVLDTDDPSDAEWTIRRAVCHRLAGSKDGEFAADDPIHAHIRGFRAASGPDPAHALADLKHAAAAHRSSGRGDLAIEADLARAEVLERLGRIAEAEPIYAAIERDASSLDPDPIRRASQPALELAARAARGLARAGIKANRPGHAFAALDRSMSPKSAFEPGGLLGVPASEFPKVGRLRGARDQLEALGGPGASPDADAAQSRVHRLRAELAGRETAIRPRDDPAGPDPGTLGLADDESILIVAEAGPETIAGILYRGRSEPIARILPIGQTDLRQSIATWRAGLGDGGRPLGFGPPPRALPILGLAPEPNLARADTPPARVEARLYDAVVAPFVSQLDGVRRLFVVPGAGLAAMPLEAIGRGSRLGDRLPLRVLPSALTLPRLRDKSRIARATGNQALASMPGPLAALRAAKFSAVGLDPGSQPLSKWSAFVVLHLDDRVIARDLAATPLCARVVVVETTDTSTAGIQGWADAGLQAGADAVLVEIWTHPAESSRIFFEAFYRALGSGQEPAEALGKARVVVARDPRFHDPVHWAGYVLFGL